MPQTSESRHDRARRVAGGSTFGAAVAVATGSTPVGVALVAGLAGALSWRAAKGRRSGS